MHPIIMANVKAAKTTNSDKSHPRLSLQPEQNECTTSNEKENENIFFHGFIKCDWNKFRLSAN